MTRKLDYTNEEYVKRFKDLPLTKVQRETINLMEKGYTIKEIAEIRGALKKTVKSTIDLLDKSEGKLRQKMEEIKGLKKYDLTDIQRETVTLLGDGYTVREVANIRGVGENGIYTVIKSIKKRKERDKTLESYKELVEKHGDIYIKHDKGLLLIDKNGEGYRWRKIGYERYPQVVDKTGRKSLVYEGRDGKQEKLYIHRVVAELYLNSQKKQRYVDFKDGDKGNVKASNLKWVHDTEERKENYKRQGERLKEALGKCEMCGEPTHNIICMECKDKEKQKENKKNKVRRIEQEYEGAEGVELTKKEKYILGERRKGKPLREIGEKESVTGQAIDLRLKSIKERIIKNENKKGDR